MCNSDRFASYYWEARLDSVQYTQLDTKVPYMDVDTIGRRSGRGKTLALVYPRSNWQHDRRCPTQPIPRRDFRARRRSLNAMVHDASAATQLMHAHRPMVNTWLPGKKKGRVPALAGRHKTT